MKKEIILKYEGLANEILLIFTINQLNICKKYTLKSTKNKLIHIAIELINNMISHSDNTENCKFELYKENSKFVIETQNYYKGQKFKIAKSKFDDVYNSESIDKLIQDSLKKSLPKKSSHLGIIKIYEKTGGNFKIGSTTIGNKVLFKTKSVINEKD